LFGDRLVYCHIAECQPIDQSMILDNNETFQMESSCNSTLLGKFRVYSVIGVPDAVADNAGDQDDDGNDQGNKNRILNHRCAIFVPYKCVNFL